MKAIIQVEEEQSAGINIRLTGMTKKTMNTSKAKVNKESELIFPDQIRSDFS